VACHDVRVDAFGDVISTGRSHGGPLAAAEVLGLIVILVIWLYDADQTVMAFAGRLKDAVDLDSVREDLAAVVGKSLEPAHVSVWIQADPDHRRPGGRAGRAEFLEAPGLDRAGPQAAG
jgi:hypothetical protein